MTPAQTIKQLYRAAKGDHPKFMSLKAFAKSINGDNKELAETWKANKTGALEKTAKEERQKNKGGKLDEMRLKSKSGSVKK